MKILMVSNNYTPFSGGVVSSLNAFIIALQKQDHQVTLVTLNFLGDHSDDPVWVKRIWCPIRFKYKTNHMALPWRAKLQLSTIFNEVRPDIVHVHHPFLLGPAANAVAKKQKLPVIFTYHTVYEAYAHYVPLPQRLVKQWVTMMVLSFCHKVDGIIAPSGFIYRYLQDKGIKKPLTIIPSPLQAVFVSHKKIIKEPHPQLRLLVVSRMVKEKNISALLDVARILFEQNVDFSLRLIGYGADYQTLKEYAYQNLKLPQDRVRFIHKPTKSVIAQAYRNADLFLFSSSNDTQGLVLAEAMAGGTPVIAFNGPGQRDIIKQGENGFIVSNEKEMADTIMHLSNNRKQLAALSENAWQTAQAYSPESLSKRLVQFYRHIMDLCSFLLVNS